MRLECREIDDSRGDIRDPMYFKKGMYAREEVKGFAVGFTVSILASVVAMYIFWKFLAEKTATAAVKKYVEEQQQQNLHQWIQRVSESPRGFSPERMSNQQKLYSVNPTISSYHWKPLSNDILKNIKNIIEK